jgi:hypothetical protein
MPREIPLPAIYYLPYPWPLLDRLYGRPLPLPLPLPPGRIIPL